MKKLLIIGLLFGIQQLSFAYSYAKKDVNSGKEDREYWIETMTRIFDPVISNLSNNTLRKNIPIGRSPSALASSREFITHMESVGRTFAGIAPWLELGPDNTREGQLRKKYIEMSVKALANSVDPDSPDYFDSKETRQILVNSAFLIQGLLRAPNQLWGNLDDLTKKRLIEQWKMTREMVPGQNNWLLFSAMVEIGLKEFAGEWDFEVVEKAIVKHQEWYLGDGCYGDGAHFRLDYYNSYVIQPMMLDILKILKKHQAGYGDFYEMELPRFVRYAEIQERLISPEGTYPVVGRSITYRMGSMQVLAQSAYEKILPEKLTPAQVRSALTAVIRNQISQEGTFDKDGWLNIGFCGNQAELGDSYLSTPCLYLCSLIYLPLGLPENDEFWVAPAADWTNKRAWTGRSITADKAYKDGDSLKIYTKDKGYSESKVVSFNPTVPLSTPLEDRAFWVNIITKIADPVLINLSKNTLRKNMPVEKSSGLMPNAAEHKTTHLEALGRLLTGIAPWLELGPDHTLEGKKRKEYIQLSVHAVKNAVNPESPDYMNFKETRQPLVDAAFLAQGMLRAPKQLWGNLDKTTQKRLINEWKVTRNIKPLESNWLLFSATVEAALLEFSGEWDSQRVEYALDKFKEWYKGDGWYGDGPDFHFDYYNSYVIHPMMMDVLSVMKKHNKKGNEFYEEELPRFVRHAAQLERMISPEGTFPAVGRSLPYRFGAMQVLSQAALMKELPDGVTPEQVRSALTAVIRRQAEAPGTFDSKGWLQIGFCGHQPLMAERYITTGSLYLCTAGMVALGLPSTDEFWVNPCAEWTGLKGWTGKKISSDKTYRK